MSTAVQYKCPNCGGMVEFDSGHQRLKCPYCDTLFSIDDFSDIENIVENAEPETLHSSWAESEAGDFSIYNCKSCGAEIITDKTTAATHCPYCNTPVVISGRLSGELKPDVVIPFKLDKEKAKASLRSHICGRKLLPKVFTTEHHIDEIKGVYVPFWLYDTVAVSDASYKMTNTRTWSDRDFRYVETSEFSGIRSASVLFSSIPEDGSEKMADDLMESLEPFDYNEAVPFKPAYLSGYFANRYDHTAKDYEGRVLQRVSKSASDALLDTVKGYGSVITLSEHTKLTNTRVKYALYPVWILNTTWRDKKYMFAMNGQTGKFVGNLPIDHSLYTKWRLLYSAIFAAGLTAASVCLWYFGII